MQALAAPVGGREQRHLDLRPVRHARLPEVGGVELVAEAVLVEVARGWRRALPSDNSSGPDTQSPVMRLRKPRAAAAVLQRQHLRARDQSRAKVQKMPP